MPAKDLGTKHTCWKCGTRFYDLKKPAPLCPKCGSDARANPAVRTAGSVEKKRTPPREEPVEEAVEDLDSDKEEEGVEDEPEERDDE